MSRSTFSGPVASLNGFIVGSSGTQLTLVQKGTIAVDPASCANAAVTEVTLTITGALVGDAVIMNSPAAGLTAGLINGGARVSAADTVKLRIANLSGGTVDEASGTWTYVLLRS